MRKVIAILVVIGLIMVMASGVIAADVIAGNDVIDRPNGPDSWTNFYLADRNNGFVEDTIMTGFSAYVKRLSPFKFMVFTQNEDVWEIVYESEEIVPTELGVYNGVVDPGVVVPAGSFVGLYYPTNGAVPFTVDDDEGDVHFEGGVLTRAVLFTNNDDGPEFVDFYNSGDRIYSIQALGIMVPESGWLTPIAKEGYRMNVKSTLPVKFRLEGEFEDVKLMINEEEVVISLKDCEEDCDFYMGLFRPSEPGEYTATVLVNGAPVLTKDFVVYENPSKNTVKAKIKAKVKGKK